MGFHNFRHTQSPKLLFIDSRDAIHSNSDGAAAITVVKDGATNNYTITVPAGNYTVTSLAQKLKEDIEAKIGDGATNVTITYDRITNKFKFAISPATRSVTIHGATSSDLTTVVGLTTEDFTILDKPGSVITHSPSNSVYKALIQTEAVRAITGNYAHPSWLSSRTFRLGPTEVTSGNTADGAVKMNGVATTTAVPGAPYNFFVISEKIVPPPPWVSLPAERLSAEMHSFVVVERAFVVPPQAVAVARLSTVSWGGGALRSKAARPADGPPLRIGGPTHLEQTRLGAIDSAASENLVMLDRFFEVDGPRAVYFVYQAQRPCP
eukprot:SAG22_NODE_2725_length_2277_cov_6.265840_3_plen_322_part_00